MPGKQVLKFHSPHLGRPVLGEAGAPSSRLHAGSVGCLGHLKEHITCRHPFTPSAGAAEGQSFSAPSTLGLHSQVFPPQPEARQRGQWIRSARPAAICTLGSVLGLLGPGVPAAHAAWLWKQKAHARVSAGVQLRIAGEEWGHCTCHLQGSSLEMQHVRPTPSPAESGLHLNPCVMPMLVTV